MSTAAPIRTAIPTGTWTLDPTHSSASFAVRHMAVATFRGHFEQLDARLVAGADGPPRLTGSVRADSIAVKDENLAAHLAAPEFFDAERHPEIRFASTALHRNGDELVVDGELTIKGRTRPMQARGTITDPVVTVGDVEKIGIALEATIDRTAFGLEWNAPLPKGGLALANEVRLVVELELARAEG